MCSPRFCTRHSAKNTLGDMTAHLYRAAAAENIQTKFRVVGIATSTCHAQCCPSLTTLSSFYSTTSVFNSVSYTACNAAKTSQPVVHHISKVNTSIFHCDSHNCNALYLVLLVLPPATHRDLKLRRIDTRLGCLLFSVHKYRSKK